MKAHGVGWRAWTSAVVAALIVLVLVTRLFRFPAEPQVRPAPERSPLATSPVGLIRLKDNEDRLLREDAMLRDPTPLFLPTRWNVADNPLLVGTQREPGLSFPGYGPKLSFPDSGIRLQLPAPVPVPPRPADAFAVVRPSVPYQGFGETDEPAPSLSPRAAYVEVVSSDTGQLMLAQPLTDVQLPADGAWQPLEFLIAIDRAGLVRPPVLTTSSRLASVDSYFQDYLATELRLGARLEPGFYRVSFGP